MDLRNILILVTFGVVAVVVIVLTEDFSDNEPGTITDVEEARLGIWSFTMVPALAGRHDCYGTAQVGNKRISIVAGHIGPFEISFRGASNQFRTTVELSQLSFRIDDRPAMRFEKQSETHSQGRQTGAIYTIERNTRSANRFIEAFQAGDNLYVIDDTDRAIATFALKDAHQLFEYLNQC